MAVICITGGKGIFFRAALLVVFTPLWVVSMALGQNEVEMEYVPKVVVVQFEPSVFIAHKSGITGLQEFDKRASKYQVHLIERVYPFLDHVEPTPKTRRNLMALRQTYYVRYDSDAAPEQVAKDLHLAPGVIYAEPIMANRTQALLQVDPNDPGFRLQTELRQLHLPEAWDVVKGEDGSPQVVIAIVDGGGEWRHEDLRANVWINSDEIADNGIDDDQNGFIDDVHGINFPNMDDMDNDPSGFPTSEYGEHGTFVAGAAGAVTDNGIGVAGAAWNADIMHINSGCSDPELREIICYGYEGILYAAANGADIINASWGSTASSESRVSFIDQSLNLATDMGALIVAAAGNDTTIIGEHHRFYPALHPRTLSVGATEKESRTLANFSNYGKLVTVFAPGQSIITTGPDHEYYRVSGTSVASPLVAGVAALVKTRYPNMSPDRLREYIRITSENIDAENPNYTGELGNGFVNALAAVQQSPSLPAVQLKRWTWTDDDGNGEITSGDEVALTAVFVNYLADAQQLRVELTGEESYPFLSWRTREVNIGFLGGGDSVAVEFLFSVSDDAPVDQQIRLLAHVRDGEFEASVGILDLSVNKSLVLLHQALSAFYTSTNGDGWSNNSGWDVGAIPPSIEHLQQWHGLSVADGFLVDLILLRNNLNGSLPPELGDLTNLERLSLHNNDLTGEIPSELGNLMKLEQLWLNSNQLTNEIPSELGSLLNLEGLGLSDNQLTGEIPPELGNLTNLEQLWLHENDLTGEIPSELGNLTKLYDLRLAENNLTDTLPRSFLQLQNLDTLYFANAGVCAPRDDEFQAWLSTISNVDGPTCSSVSFSDGIVNQSYPRTQPIVPLILPEAIGGRPPISYALAPVPPEGLRFDPSTRTLSGTPTEITPPDSFTYTATDMNGSRDSLTFTIEVYLMEFTTSIDNQSYPRTHPITPLILPEATGVPPIAYALAPMLPEGLSFDSSTRTVAGAPTEVTPPVSFTYKGTDANGAEDSLRFTIEVYSPVAIEHETLPEEFALRANYPNPFHHLTRLVFDLPWPAKVQVEVMDVTGRRVITAPSVDIAAGWGQEIEMSGTSLPSGLYLYRLTVTSSKNSSMHVGHFTRIR